MIVGQVSCGILGDAIGRHRIYGKELMITMFGVMMCILLPWKGLSHGSIVAWMFVWRFVTGLGIGGGEPKSNTNLTPSICPSPNDAALCRLSNVFDTFRGKLGIG